MYVCIIRTYVCMYVCMYVYIYMYVGGHGKSDVRRETAFEIQRHPYMYVLCMYVYVCMYNVCMYMYACIHMCVCGGGALGSPT
jgi:hypothetical protein